MRIRIAGLALLLSLAAAAQDVREEAEDEQSLEEAESGKDEDSAPQGFDSRASGRPDKPRTLAEIKQSGYVRVLTRNNDTSFFIHRGHRLGFDYEMGKKLAQRMGIRVDMVITQEWDEMVPALLRGEGDVIAAQVSVTEERKQQVLFSDPWGKTHEVVVWKKGTKAVKSAEDLAGKSVHVRRASTYYDTLADWNAKLRAAKKPEIQIKIVAEDWETDTILDALSRGEIKYTIADELIAELQTAHHANLVIGPRISPERQLAWAVRPGDHELVAQINGLFKELKKGPLFNVLVNKYFKADRFFRKNKADKFYAAETGTLSPYDDLIRKHAEKYELDWRLVASQIYQESRFDPKKKSWVGAVGLFQMMPGTAKEMKIKVPTDPEQSIVGGLKYMKKLTKHYKDVEDPIERYRFALAAYNAGFGHVDDARKFAREEGKDPKKWRDVAQYMLKLSDRKYASRARFGFCRGFEPFEYVRKIDERYAGYAQLVPLKREKRQALRD